LTWWGHPAELNILQGKGNTSVLNSCHFVLKRVVSRVLSYRVFLFFIFLYHVVSKINRGAARHSYSTARIRHVVPIVSCLIISCLCIITWLTVLIVLVHLWHLFTWVRTWCTVVTSSRSIEYIHDLSWSLLSTSYQIFQQN
jgi:hypothetical protein